MNDSSTLPRSPTLPGGLRRTTLARWVLIIGLAAGLGAVLFLWWHNTPAVTGSTAAELMAAGRLTGLAGAYLILVQLLLMSRLKWLDRAVGSHGLTAWHRDLGAGTVILLLAHTLLITLGYSATAHTGFFGQSWTFIRSYPDVLMAYVALALFTGVGFTSIRAIRRRMAYETWYYLHFYVYLALALGFAHQFADGAEFSASLPARIFWSVLHLGVVAALLYGRVWQPLRLNLKHRLRVVLTEQEAPGIVSVYVAGRWLNELDSRAGQFFRWRFLTRDGWWQAHPFSLSAAPSARTMRITVKALGDHTKTLRRLRPGVRVFAEGPYGTFTADQRHCDDVLLIAGGIGIAPIRALLDDLPPGRAVVLYRARRPKDLVLSKEIDQIAERTGTRVVYLPGSVHRDALSAGGLTWHVPDIARRDVFVCGPPGMVQAVQSSLRKLRIPQRQIHVDPFEM